MNTNLLKLKKALLEVNELKASRIVKEVVDNNSNFMVGLAQAESIILKSQEVIGEEWENGHVSLAQVYMSGVICEKLINDLFSENIPQAQNGSRIAIAVLDDFHSLGKKMVKSFLKMNGYRITDYGSGIDVDQLVENTIADKIQILLISVLMLPSALKTKQLIDKIKAINSTIRVIVGGAPFRLDQTLWKEVGADACGSNMTDAVKCIEQFQTAN